MEIEIKVCGGRDFTNKSDIDNTIKSAVDFLVKAEIFPEDSLEYVQRTSARHFPFSGGESLTIISYLEPVD